MTKLLVTLAFLFCTACKPEGQLAATETARPPEADRAIIRYDHIHHPVVSRRGMVVSQNEIASEAGAEILAKGGNAVDAAVATGLVLAVTLPRAGNIGGSGFMLVHLADTDRTIALDYYSAAPRSADREAFRTEAGDIDRRRRYSHLGPAVPGTIAGFDHVLTKYGSMTWRQVAQPAIDLARHGLVVTDDLHFALETKKEILFRDPETRALYFGNDGSVIRAGERIVFSDLAATLEKIADQGADAFYRGEIARQIDLAMAESGGFISSEDLTNYQVYEEEPLWCNYRGFDIAMTAPSSSGVYACELLNIVENFSLREMGPQTAELYHVLSESMKLVFADRSKFSGGRPHYQMPVAMLTDKDYARGLAESIELDRAKPYADVQTGAVTIAEESRDTTHYSIADEFGNVVSNTYTLGSSFGSGVTVPDTGILLNDHVANFALSVGVPNATGFQANQNNELQEGRRAVSTITPIIIFRDGKPYVASGSPGGTRIISTVAQLVVSLVDHDMSIAEATHSPRMHQEWNSEDVGEMEIEPGHSLDTVRILTKLGHNVRPAPTMGSLQSIQIQDEKFYGAADPRRPGSAAVGID